MNNIPSKHIPLEKIKIDDPFWNEVGERVRTKVIPYQYRALNDLVDGAEKSHSVENFVKAGKVAKALKNGEEVKKYPCDKWCYDNNNSDADSFHGWVFQDSDIYKWLEATAYSLISRPDEKLRQKADELIDIVCDAQLDNGYLNTCFIINDIDKAFTNLRDFHELYCFGHLAEAGEAYFRATGNRKLLDAALKFADLICEKFGDGEAQIKGYPGHEIAELALVKLYEITGEKRYLETAEFFIRQRGKRPFYFDEERNQTTDGKSFIYNQAHDEVINQSEALGHAVRGVYLYSGMADIVRYTNDDKIYTACKNIWDNIENKKLYITGGIGATVHGEAFSFDYDLPNDLAYSETCASIGLMFFARRMAEINAESNYGAVSERALYNTVLSSMSEDGNSFFYVNPLEVLPEASRLDERKKHVKPTRQKWFSCACCPPNLARLVLSLGEYAFSENEDTFFVHQYIGAQACSRFGKINIKSDYVRNGRVKITASDCGSFTLALRIPEWCESYSISKEYEIKNGYAYINLDKNEEVRLRFEVVPRLVKCSNRVRENIGKAALQRGMFVYCLESVDNGENLQMLSVNRNTEFVCDGEFIVADGIREKPDTSLYSDYADSEAENVKIKFLPYYRWGNRGENEMQIYFRIK